MGAKAFVCTFREFFNVPGHHTPLVQLTSEHFDDNVGHYSARYFTPERLLFWFRFGVLFPPPRRECLGLFWWCRVLTTGLNGKYMDGWMDGYFGKQIFYRLCTNRWVSGVPIKFEIKQQCHFFFLEICLWMSHYTFTSYCYLTVVLISIKNDPHTVPQHIMWLASLGDNPEPLSTDYAVRQRRSRAPTWHSPHVQNAYDDVKCKS